MISKKKLRKRLLDICNGAGRRWLEDDEYFESDDSALEATGRMIQGIENSFDFPDDTRLRFPWQLGEMDHIDTLVNLVYFALQNDMPKDK